MANENINISNSTVNITIRQAAQEAIDNSNIEGAAGVKITYLDGRVEMVFSQDSPILKVEILNEDGSKSTIDTPLPEGASVEPIYSAEGAK